MKTRKLLTALMAVTCLTGCTGQAAAKEIRTGVETQVTESSVANAEPQFHPDRYTDEQKNYLCTLWGKEEWEKGGYNDDMAELYLLGSGCEVGHKTSGIASGFSYEMETTDLPESSGNKKVNYKTIETWAHMAKNFRLEDALPYQYTLKPDVTAPKFHVIFPMEEGDDYTFDILGHKDGDRVCIEWMMVYFHEENHSYTHSIYEHLNYIQSVLEDENKDWNQAVPNVMEGSVDGEGAYINLFTQNHDGYAMAEEGMLDGRVPVRIMKFNGEPLAEKEQPAINYYVEWGSLEHGKHELTVEFTGPSGSKQQATIPFTY